MSFYVKNRLFILDKTTGLNEYKNESLVPVNGGAMFSETVDIGSMLSFGNFILIGSGNQGLFLLSDDGIKTFKSEADELLIQNKINCGIQLLDKTLAFGTIRGGIIIINSEGKFIQQINKSSGLQNDNIKALFLDRNNDLWAALNNGISKIEIPSPFSYYDESSGIRGGVNDIIYYQDRYYFATSQGLMYLDPVDHIFKFIPGIFTSCWSLIIAENSLLAASSEGVFEIKDLQSKQLSKEFTLSVKQSISDPKIIYAGQTAGLGIIKYENGWNWSSQLPLVQDEIRRIEEDGYQNLWLETPSNGIILLNLSQEKIRTLDTSNGLPSMLGNHINYIRNEIYVSSSSGIYKWNSEADSFILSNLLSSSDPGSTWIYKMIEDKEGNIWSNEGDETGIRYSIRQANGQYRKLNLPLEIIEDFVVWVIYPALDNSVWVGGPEGIVIYNHSGKRNFNRISRTYIRSISIGNDSLIYSGGNINPAYAKLHYDESTIKFSYTSNSMDARGENLYQFYLEGFDKFWSEWTQETQKEYTNLPDGKYVFHVRSRNVYNIISTEAEFAFEVLTPWYKSWWAIAIYIAILLLLFLITARIRSNKLIYEKKILENLIAERTKEAAKERKEFEKQSAELAIKNDELEKINLIVKAINSENQQEAVLQSLLEKTRIIKGVERATALILDQESNNYRFIASYGWDLKSLSNIRLSFEDAEERYLRNTEEVFEDIFYSNNFQPHSTGHILINVEVPAAIIIIVIKHADTIEGFLILENMSRREAFDKKDFTLLKNLKELIISAFVKHRLLQNH